MLYCSSECGSISIMRAVTRNLLQHVCIYISCVLIFTCTSIFCNSTYFFKCSFQIYQKSIVVFIRSSKVWFKTTWCAKGPVTRCNFPGNLQRNSALKRCKLVTNVWYVKNILANCNVDESCPWFFIGTVLAAVRSARESRSVALVWRLGILVTGAWFCAHGKQ